MATKDGLRNIEEIQVGDEAWSYDEKTGEIGLKPVVHTFQRTTDLLVKLEIDSEVITTTPEHPFYANGDWKEAGLLQTDDSIMLFSGRLATVNSIKYEGVHAPIEIADSLFGEQEIVEENHTTVFNFEVEGWHTYFVGMQQALVHNTGGVCIKQVTKKSWEQLGKKLPCFPAGTLVHTLDGKLRIEFLTPGMEIYAYDLINQKKISKKINGVYKNETRKLLTVTIDHSKTITTTMLHRFWIVDKQSWIEAERLRIGMCLINSDSTILQITDLVFTEVSLTPTYNFEVEELNNYFVGDSGSLVHNGKPSVFESTKKTNAKIYKITDRKTKQTVYVGKTIQGGDKRFSQHTIEKGLDKKKFKVETISKGRWTAYETAVREQHNIKKYGTKTAKLSGKYAHVFNRINAISERKFNKFFNLHNLC